MTFSRDGYDIADTTEQKSFFEQTEISLLLDMIIPALKSRERCFSLDGFQIETFLFKNLFWIT